MSRKVLLLGAGIVIRDRSRETRIEQFDARDIDKGIREFVRPRGERVEAGSQFRLVSERCQVIALDRPRAGTRGHNDILERCKCLE